MLANLYILLRQYVKGILYMTFMKVGYYSSTVSSLSLITKLVHVLSPYVKSVTVYGTKIYTNNPFNYLSILVMVIKLNLHIAKFVPTIKCHCRINPYVNT